MRAGRQLSDSGKDRRCTCRLDDPVGCTRRDVGAGVGALADAERCGHTLAGEHRGVDLDVIRCGEGDVGRNAVTGRQHHDVAHDDFGCAHHDGLSIAAHDYSDRKKVLQAFRCALGALLLHEGEEAVDDDHHDDCRGELRHARHERKHRRNPQHEREEVRELAEQPVPRMDPRWWRKDVGAVGRQASGGVGRSQTLTDRAI